MNASQTLFVFFFKFEPLMTNKHATYMDTRKKYSPVVSHLKNFFSLFKKYWKIKLDKTQKNSWIF